MYIKINEGHHQQFENLKEGQSKKKKKKKNKYCLNMNETNMNIKGKGKKMAQYNIAYKVLNRQKH